MSESLLENPDFQHYLESQDVDEDYPEQEKDDSISSYRSRSYTWPRKQQSICVNNSDHDNSNNQQFGNNLNQDSSTIIPTIIDNGQSSFQQQHISILKDSPSSSLGSAPLPLVNEEETPNTTQNLLQSESNVDKTNEDKSRTTESSTEKLNNTTDKLSRHVNHETTSQIYPRSKASSRRNPWGNMSYADLITRAIQESDEKRLTLAQIYDWLVKNVPYFNGKGDNVSSIGWKNSIRHNLSLHSRFLRVQNDGAGKSSWWMLNENSTSKQTNPTKHTRRRANTLDTVSRRELSSISGISGRNKVKNGKSKKRDLLGRTTSNSSIAFDNVNTNSNEIPSCNSNDLSHYRSRTFSNASSCGGERLSPSTNTTFRPRTLSNASSSTCDHSSPPREFLAESNGFNPSSSNNTWNNFHLPIFDFKEQLKLHESDNIKEELSPEDQEALMLLNTKLDPKSTQLIYEALQKDSDQFLSQPVVNSTSGVVNYESGATSTTTPPSTTLTMQNNGLNYSDNSMTDHVSMNIGHKLKILEQRNNYPISTNFFNTSNTNQNFLQTNESMTLADNNGLEDFSSNDQFYNQQLPCYQSLQQETIRPQDTNMMNGSLNFGDVFSNLTRNQEAEHMDVSSMDFLPTTATNDPCLNNNELEQDDTIFKTDDQELEAQNTVNPLIVGGFATDLKNSSGNESTFTTHGSHQGKMPSLGLC